MFSWGRKGRDKVNIVGFQAFSSDDSSAVTAELSVSQHQSQLYLILKNLFTGDILGTVTWEDKLLPHLLMLIISYILDKKPK